MITTKIAIVAAALVTFWATPAVARTAGWEVIPLPRGEQMPTESDEGTYFYSILACQNFRGVCREIVPLYQSTAAECLKDLKYPAPRPMTTFVCARRRVDLWEPVR